MNEEGTSEAVELRERLRAVVAAALGEPGAEVRGLRQLTGGASRETWAFEAGLPDGSSPRLVLRRDPPAAARGEMAMEAAAIRAAAAAGVPVPEIVACSDGSEELEAPYVVTGYVEGEAAPRRILREERLAAVRSRLASECGEVLARIHAIDPGEVPGLEAGDPLARLRTQLDAFEDRSPGLELAMRWLAANRPERRRETVVHGDFRNGNLIVGPDGVRAVLDWELVHRGDPVEDLGWLCVRAWRFGAAPPVGGFGPYEDLLRGYERASGKRVELDEVLWWQVHGCVRWGAICMEQAWRHLSGAVGSVELAAVGRRVWEQEYDVLTLLEERIGAG